MTEQNQNKFNENGSIKVKLWVPKNDNLLPVLGRNIGESLSERVQEMLTTKLYRDKVPYEDGKLELHLAAAEGIAEDIIETPDSNTIGITGSDFVLANILDRKYHHFHTMTGRGLVGYGEEQKKWEIDKEIWEVDKESGRFFPTDHIFMEGLNSGTAVRFESLEKTVEMRILENYEQPPFLCILGANDMTYEQLIEKRKQEKMPVKVVWEERFDVLARSFLDAETRNYDFIYEGKEVPRSSEGYVRRGGEDERQDLVDITIEIGRTFETARNNGLDVYKKIMQTYPVEIICYKKGQPTKLYLEAVRKATKDK